MDTLVETFVKTIVNDPSLIEGEEAVITYRDFAIRMLSWISCTLDGDSDEYKSADDALVAIPSSVLKQAFDRFDVWEKQLLDKA
jgi:hypothetical protein